MTRTRSTTKPDRGTSTSVGPETPVDPDASADNTKAFRQSLQRFHHNHTHLQGKTASSVRQSLDETVPSGSKRQASSRLIPQTPTFERDSPSPAKRRRTSSKYAPPSKYAHLPALQDVLGPDLICVFIGNNPGIRTATTGHAYAHPSNLFWKLLHSSGCTDRRCKPEEDVDLPRLYMMGNTNIVERPTKDIAELSKTEMADGTSVLDEKIRLYKPEAVCIVGKGIWEAIWRYRHGKNPSKDEFKYGWQDDAENMGKGDNDRECAQDGTPWKGAKVFVASSTSGLSASTRPHEKEAIWKPFGEWVSKRRAERLAVKNED